MNVSQEDVPENANYPWTSKSWVGVARILSGQGEGVCSAVYIIENRLMVN